MLTNTLLLSDAAEFAAKPELEIYADDVQCGHGATTGQIDEAMMFYLLSRGIPRKEAEALLLRAFLIDALEPLPDRKLAAAMEPIIDAWLRGSPPMSVATRSRPTTGYDVDAIRRDFPILSRTVNGKPLVYLDSGASAQKPKVVIDRGHQGLCRGLRQRPSRPSLPRQRLDRGLRGWRGRRCGVSSTPRRPTRSSSPVRPPKALNLVAASLGAALLREGDEVVLTIMEHHSNIVPWHFHRERAGAVLKWVADRR